MQVSKIEVDNNLKETLQYVSSDFPLVIYTDKFSLFEEGYIRWHWHKYLQISYVLDDQVCFQVDGEEIILNPQEGIIFNSNVLHQIKPHNDDCKMISIMFDDSLISRNEQSLIGKKYVDTVSDGKLDKVTTAFKIYGTDGSGNQKVYQTGWSATSSIFQLMDNTPNGGYNDDGSFSSGATGTYMVAIPKKPSHATPKKWVEDNFTVYKHIVSFSVYDNAFISCSFIVYSSQSTPFTAKTLPNGAYVGRSGDLYNLLISNENGSIYATKLLDTIVTKGYILGDELYIDSDIVTKL